ncbi:hypothetical protein BOTBODRAFT_122415, partial [Botryobasidium botryosum FD-172 SS1]
GNYLPPGMPPLPQTYPANPFEPFESRHHFELAGFLFKKVQMSKGEINKLMMYWAADTLKYNADSPFASTKALYKAIDGIPYGDAPWQSFSVTYNGPLPDNIENRLAWMQREHVVWFRNPAHVALNSLDDPAIDGEIDYAAYQSFDRNRGQTFSNFMSGNFAWRHWVSIFWCFAVGYY